jgi:hypothetical protein
MTGTAHWECGSRQTKPFERLGMRSRVAAVADVAIELRDCSSLAFDVVAKLSLAKLPELKAQYP